MADDQKQVLSEEQIKEQQKEQLEEQEKKSNSERFKTFAKKAYDTTMNGVDTAIAILEQVPTYDTNADFSFNYSVNPTTLLINLLKRFGPKVYQGMLDMLGFILIGGIASLEIAVKLILIAGLKDMFTCSFNPIITEKLLSEGIVIDLDKIDILGTLQYSPLDPAFGRFYYFGNTKKEFFQNYAQDGFNIKARVEERNELVTPSELADSKDLNCVLWYAKNCASRRVVWHMDDDAKIKDRAGVPYYENTEFWNEKKGKCRKGAGIMTFEYTTKSANVANATGGSMTIQTPSSNSIHVFIGNCQEMQTDTIIRNKGEIKNAENKGKQAKAKKEKKLKEKESLENKLRDVEKKREDGKYKIKIDKNTGEKTEEEYLKAKKKYTEKLNKVKDEIAELEYQINDYGRQAKESTINLGKVQPVYRTLHQNYYHNHTLFEFNFDYVMSVMLFKPQVIVAQIIDQLSGLATVELGYNYKQEIIRQEVTETIERIMSSDDSAAPSDCFFTFSNDRYNALIKKAEENKTGLFKVSENEYALRNQDAANILNSLTNIDDDVIKNVDTQQINDVLTKISENITVTRQDVNEKGEHEDPEMLVPQKINKHDIEFKFNILDNIIEQLAIAVIKSVLSPKVLMLFLINMSIMGQNPSFDIQTFLVQFNNMITDIIRKIRDYILKSMTDILEPLITDLAKRITVKIGMEQSQYYTRLMRQLIDCFRLRRDDLDFDMAKLGYADIENQEVDVVGNETC